MIGAARRLMVVAALALAGCDTGASAGTSEPPLVLFSSDIAQGLIDTHGAQGSCPVSFSRTAMYFNDTDIVPQDVDDGLTVAMALNLEAEAMVEVDAIVPIFGNAALPAEMLVARQIAWDLKGRTDIPIVPGAMGPAGQTLKAASQWFDGETVAIAGVNGSFAAACRNAGVELMQSRLEVSSRPVTILATGPLTDVACLLLTAPEVAADIAEIIVLASRIEGESLTINDKVVNDFNFRTDPLGGALLLAADSNPPVPIRLMSFQLSGQTSQEDDLIKFDATTLTGPVPATPESDASLSWLLAASTQRDAFWTGIFGTPEGPFDQYVLAAAVWPELFECQEGLAYVQQCPYPAWSPDYPVDDSGNPTEDPYNTEPNPCTDHGAANGGSLSAIPAELVVTLDLNDSGPLVRGETGLDGNIPSLSTSARPVTVCFGFASAAARQDFEDRLYEFTW